MSWLSISAQKIKSNHLSHRGSDIAHIRTDYTLAALDESAVGDDPLSFFHKWFEEAKASHVTEINAMTLATVDAEGKPHARTVLLKGLDDTGFTFFTNYASAKGHDMQAQPYVSILFFWKELERQVRIQGKVEKLTDAENDAYFHSRPEGSRIGAWASPQSEVIADRAVIEARYKEFELKFAGSAIPRPPHWGGYRVVPSSIEFWQGRSSRLHDRILFSSSADSQWFKSRLAP